MRESSAKIHKRQWGRGRPVIALHPLGLDSSGFAGFGKILAARGARTIAFDLPGFGKSPAPDEGLTPSLLAAPVVARARAMKEKPVVIGISLGGRVALEAAMTAPEAFDSVVAIAPYMPWRRYRLLLQGGRLIGPGAAGWLPLERLWPQLRWLAGVLETTPYVREDELAQSAARFVYYLACPATRASFFSAARELALDPAFGERGFWTRLAKLPIPAVFVWGERDGLVSWKLSGHVRDTLPSAMQVLVPCAGHWLNGPHHRCLADSVAALLEGPLRTGRTCQAPAGARIGEMATGQCLLGERAARVDPALVALAGAGRGR
jgi:pimeloyl-ACP methyl ester carboxylesterase